MLGLTVSAVHLWFHTTALPDQEWETGVLLLEPHIILLYEIPAIKQQHNLQHFTQSAIPDTVCCIENSSLVSLFKALPHSLTAPRSLAQVYAHLLQLFRDRPHPSCRSHLGNDPLPHQTRPLTFLQQLAKLRPKPCPRVCGPPI